MADYESLSKNHRQWIRRLHRRKYRSTEKLFIAEGIHALTEARAGSRYPITEIIVEGGRAGSIRDRLPDGIPIYRCSEQDMKAISTEETPQGVVIVCREQESRFDDLSVRFPAVMLYLDRIADPGNLGTIIRTAAWFDSPAVILSPSCVDPFNTKVIRASAGSIFRTELYRSIAPERLSRFAKQNNCRLIAAVPEGGTPVYRLERGDRDIILLGQEASGLSQEVMNCAAECVSIPGTGNVESLNLAVAAAIILYERARP